MAALIFGVTVCAKFHQIVAQLCGAGDGTQRHHNLRGGNGTDRSGPIDFEFIM
jgi:hypothetical protein